MLMVFLILTLNLLLWAVVAGDEEDDEGVDADNADDDGEMRGELGVDVTGEDVVGVDA